ncbi:MAG: hypothetical protein WBX15_17785 [Thermoanaerobaculia bacterium]
MKPGWKSTEFLTVVVIFIVAVLHLFGMAGNVDVGTVTASPAIAAIVSVLDKVLTFVLMAWPGAKYIAGRSAVKASLGGN